MPPPSATHLIGHKSLDADHERIIALWRSLEASKTMEAARAAVSQLLDEAIGHFAREEDFMRQCGFPGLADHRVRHQDLASDLRRSILSPMLASGTRHDFIGTARALLNRLVTHILVEDAKIAPYARALASRMSKTMAKAG